MLLQLLCGRGATEPEARVWQAQGFLSPARLVLC